MKILNVHKTLLLEFICFLYVLLFVYAAVSKLIDFNQFKIQLGQSPILTAYSNWIAWGVPIAELIIAFLFLCSRSMLLAFYFSFSLMTIFTTYIILILNFSDYIPCSCGGILETLSWNSHLTLNFIFIGLAVVGIFILEYQIQYNKQ